MNDAGVEGRFQAAVAHHRQGDFAAAIGAYRAVLAVRPDHSAALANLASALKRLGRNAEARRVDAQHSVAITNALFASLYSDRCHALAMTRLHKVLPYEPLGTGC